MNFDKAGRRWGVKLFTWPTEIAEAHYLSVQLASPLEAISSAHSAEARNFVRRNELAESLTRSLSSDLQIMLNASIL